jgi:hypothetical protein
MKLTLNNRIRYIFYTTIRAIASASCEFAASDRNSFAIAGLSSLNTDARLPHRSMRER